MKNTSRITIYINITASILFVLYFVLISIKPNNDKKVEIENKNKVLQHIKISNLENDLIIKDVTLPHLNTKKLDYKNKKNFKLLPSKIVPENKIVKNIKINPIEYSDIKVKDLKIKTKNLPILRPVVFEKKVEPISIKPIKKNPLRINDKDKVKVNVDNKELLKFNKSELIKNGKNILDNVKDDFLFEFRWPLETRSHDKIYKILNECLFSQTVLLNKNNQIFGLNGLINRNDFKEKYSSIIRMPNNVYSTKENSIIKQIRTKYLNNEKGRHLRIFDKNTDAYIIGYLLKISERNYVKLKKIKGQYLIENNELYLDKLVINNKPISNRILLSQLNKRC